MANPTSESLISELSFSTSRSSGPGGQNVNKVNSKVKLQFDVTASRILTEDQKQLIIHKLAPHVTRDGVLVITVQETRSQADNKEIALEKFDMLLAKAFAKRKIRKATKPSKAAKQARLEKKKFLSEKKKWRKKPPAF